MSKKRIYSKCKSHGQLMRTARIGACATGTILFGLLAAGCTAQQPNPQSSPATPNATAPTSASPSQSVQKTAALPVEKPVPPEKNPPGDIPDSQAFVTFTSKSGGYSLKAPEGWARSENGANVKFVEKVDGEQVEVTKSATTPTIASIKSIQVAALQQKGHAIKIKQVVSKSMGHGNTAIVVTYDSNSETNPVTGKKIRQENATYYYYRQGKLAALTLWAPAGADNVDQWKLISESFRWQ
jgi:hypothetical protein